jgi:lipopolysaccharide/colanic/teichoic acid biosynthesis glycosyltransferase
VVSLSERRGVFPLKDVLNCKFNGIKVIDAPSFYEERTGKLLIEDITPSWLIFSDGFRKTAMKCFCKRILDIFMASIGLMLTLPLFPVIALVIKIDSPGPIFFRQLRVGEKEKNFILYKFRTMKQNAESGTGPVWAQKNDSRITRVGKFLRRTRLDEIPQLYNILVGDMSFIGPRPERPEFVEELKKKIPFYAERHSYGDFCHCGLSAILLQERFPTSRNDTLEIHHRGHREKNFRFFKSSVNSVVASSQKELQNC